MNNSIMPLPEAIDGKPWIIREGSGSCDTVGRALAVPTDSRDSSRFVRNHEMGHAKITPRVGANKLCKKFDVSMDALQVCEDLRVHHYLRRTGIDMCGSLDTDEDADSLVRECIHSDRQLALYLVAATHTDDYHRFRRALERRLDENLVADLRRLTHLVASRMACGRGLDRPIGFRNGTIPAARLFDAIFPADGSPSKLPPDALDPHRGGRKVKWGEIQIEKLPMAASRPIPAAAGACRFHDHGSVLGAVHRFAADGRIFTQRTRKVGGTVLIDASGSMGLSKDDLERIVKTAPLATVAAYAGRRRNGVLMVVASKGRMVTGDAIRVLTNLHGNVVDGPALQWLARQPEPRFWISDGLVTGMADRQSVDLVVDAMQICGKAAITRVEGVEGVCRLLESGARNAFSTKEKAR
jgi:hypothetical protein